MINQITQANQGQLSAIITIMQSNDITLKLKSIPIIQPGLFNDNGLSMYRLKTYKTIITSQSVPLRC